MDDYDYDLEAGDGSTFAQRFQVETQIRAIKQGEKTIQELYDSMVNLWDQMEKLEPNELNTSSIYREFEEESRIIQFLLALRDEFEPFKRSLLLRRCIDVIPSLEEVVSQLKTEERRLGFAVDEDGAADESLVKFSSLSVKMAHAENDEPAPSEDASLGDDAGVSWKFTEEYHSGFKDSSTPKISESYSGYTEYSNILKIMSYNVCIWDIKLQERMEAIGKLVQLHAPDIICFQEVTATSYNIFKKSSWWNEYDCSVSPEETTECLHFCIQLSRVPIKSFRTRPFRNSGMGRELCIADIEICKGKSLLVGTSHLESRAFGTHTVVQMHSEERVAQAKEAVNFLHMSSKNVIFCGDMNWDDEEDGSFPLPQGWSDAWRELRPWLRGLTCDTKSNPMLIANRPLQSRLDRFLVKLNDFKLAKISMIGTEAIPGVTYLKEKRMRTLELPVLPSDHYGLLLEIRRK